MATLNRKTLVVNSLCRDISLCLSDVILDTGNYATEGDNFSFDWFNLDRQTVARISALLKMEL